MITKEYPLISILLPVYNAELFVHESIKSIQQQSYPHWELLIADDGSKDNSVAIIESFNDNRIRLLKKDNTGMGDSLNKLLSLAKGDYIARQDADDISLPQRFEKQVAFLEKNPAVGLVGTWSEIIDTNGKKSGRYHKHPRDSKELKMDLFFDNPFVHSSVMFRKNILTDCGSYNGTLPSLVQDFEYWFRISEKHEVANIPEILHEYREIETSISRISIDFGTVVAEQSSKNISSVLKEENQNILQNFAYLYHDSKKLNAVVNTKLFYTFKNIIHSLEKIITNNKPQDYSEKHLKILKNKFYNYFINLPDSSLQIKLYYRIKRRVLLYQTELKK